MDILSNVWAGRMLSALLFDWAHAGISPMGLASMVLAGAWLAVAGVGKDGVSRGLIPWGQLTGPGSWCKHGPGPMGSAM